MYILFLFNSLGVVLLIRFIVKRCASYSAAARFYKLGVLVLIHPSILCFLFVFLGGVGGCQRSGRYYVLFLLRIFVFGRVVLRDVVIILR